MNYEEESDRYSEEDVQDITWDVERDMPSQKGGASVSCYQGDITRASVGAIVNAANPRLLGGGGVDGCIHRAAGPQLREECLGLPEQAPGIRCYPGEAQITNGYNLPATYVIHTVGPIFPQGRDLVFPGEQVFTVEQAVGVLAECIRNSLTLAGEYGLQDIVFPAISCGVYGCKVEVFASVARQVINELVHWGSVKNIQFCLFTEEELREFERGWNCSCVERAQKK